MSPVMQTPDQLYINQFPMDVNQINDRGGQSQVHRIVGVLLERDGTGKIYRDAGSQIVLAEEFTVSQGYVAGGTNWRLFVERGDGAEEEWAVKATGGCKCNYKNNALGNFRDLRMIERQHPIA